MALDTNTLQNLAGTGLEQYLGAGPQAMEDALYNRMAADIERQSGLNAQQAMENTFGRGVGQAGGGPSSITSTALDPILRARSDALTKARNDAFVASQQAQLAALAQAAGTAQTAINSSTAAANQSAALALQKRGQNFQRSQANQQAIGQGVGGLGAAGLQTAGLLYAPQIKKFLGGGLQGLADTGGDRMPSSALAAAGGPATAGIPSQPDLTGGFPSAATSAASALTPASFSLPDVSGPTSSALSGLSNYNFELPTDFDWSTALMKPVTSSFDWGDYF